VKGIYLRHTLIHIVWRKTYLVTANEGDTRDVIDAFGEEARVNSTGL
jgi:hypothetical protein